MADAKQEINNGSSQPRIVLAKPRLGGFGSTGFGASTSSKSTNPFGSVLRPPQLKPSSNPFLKVTDVEETGKEKEVEKPSESMLETETPKFVPLANSAPRSNSNPIPTPAPAQPATSSSGFVFGQNLSERVVMKESMNNGDVQPEDHSATNGATEMLFTSAAASVNQDDQSTSDSNSGEGLAAAAAEYERSHARPPPPATYCTTTGEEGETNVIQISCRLFAWEAGSWRERGRGVLRLNESADGGAARLVARVAGSLRVVLNTKLWPDMVLERAGLKSLRITAADAQQQVKLFLIMGAPADIAQLHRALLARVAGSKRTNTAESKQHSSQKAAERLDAESREDVVESINVDTNDVNVEVENSGIKDNRLEVDPDQKTDGEESSVDNELNRNNGNEDKTLKRKEPVEDETSPKRQCPEISIQ